MHMPRCCKRAVWYRRLCSLSRGRPHARPPPLANRPFRYNGPLTAPGLQDFAARVLLGLAPVPSVDLGSWEVLLERVHPGKVVAVAFAKAEGQGTIKLRQLAAKYQHTMHFARVAVGGGRQPGEGGPSSQEQAEAAAAGLAEWSQRLGAEVQLGSIVLLRGPGTEAEVRAGGGWVGQWGRGRRLPLAVAWTARAWGATAALRSPPAGAD